MLARLGLFISLQSDILSRLESREATGLARLEDDILQSHVRASRLYQIAVLGYSLWHGRRKLE